MDGDSAPTDVAFEEAQFTTERMGALTDGLFAIVLTLLVLELRLPERDESILLLMRDDWRVFLAWLVSFVLLARFWLVHHAITAGLRACHMRTLVLNFAVLGAVSLVPFSTDVIGTERVEEPWSTVVFAVNVGLMSLTVGLLARHTLREPHLRDPGRSVATLSRYQVHHLYVLPAAAFGAAALAFAFPFASLAILIGEFVLFAAGGLGGREHDEPATTRTTAHQGGTA
jgi:uncharacterized membrane protein